MRKLLALVFVGLALMAAGPITVNTATRVEFTDCAAGGSSSSAITRGTYLMRVVGEDSFVCWAATCAAGGEKFPAGWGMLISFGDGVTLSCRSPGATGDVIFTSASN